MELLTWNFAAGLTMLSWRLCVGGLPESGCPKCGIIKGLSKISERLIGRLVKQY